MSYNPRRPKMVLADPTHPDYSRFTLRNGTTNPLTLQSFYNQPDLTDYVNSQKRMAGFYYQHPMKEMRKPEVYDEAPFGRSMDVDSRLEVKAYKGKYPSVAEKLQTIVSFYPQFREEANNREFKEKINNKLKEIDDKLPINLPRRKEVMEKLISKYIMNHFEDKLGLMSDRKILGGIERLQERNEVSDRLLEQLTMQLRGEREAVATLGGEATEIVPQSGDAVSVRELEKRLNELKDIEENIINKPRTTLLRVSKYFFDLYNLPSKGIIFDTEDKNETQRQTGLMLDVLKSELDTKLKDLSEDLKNAIRNTTEKNMKEFNLLGKMKLQINKKLSDDIQNIEENLPEAPMRPPVPRGETKSDEIEGAEEREAKPEPLPLFVESPPRRGRPPKGK
jgi:hypothetical protein